MTVIAWLIVGGAIGWIASILMTTDGRQGLLLNMLLGVLGALLGGWLLAPVFGAEHIDQNDFSLTSIAVSSVGAILLLTGVNLLHVRTR